MHGGELVALPARKGLCPGSRSNDRNAAARCAVSQDLNARDRASLRGARLGLRRAPTCCCSAGHDRRLTRSRSSLPVRKRIPRFGLTGSPLRSWVTAVVPLVVLDVERAKDRISMFLPCRGPAFIDSKIVSMVSSACFLRQLALGHQDGDQVTLQHACTPRGPAVENVRRMGTLHERPGREQAPICMNFRRLRALAPPRAGGDPELAPRSRRGAPRTGRRNDSRIHSCRLGGALRPDEAGLDGGGDVVRLLAGKGKVARAAARTSARVMRDGSARAASACLARRQVRALGGAPQAPPGRASRSPRARERRLHATGLRARDGAAPAHDHAHDEASRAAAVRIAGCGSGLSDASSA